MKKLVGEEALGAIGEEIAEIGGDKFDEWLGDKSILEELEKAGKTAETCFRNSVGDYELEQWMISHSGWSIGNGFGGCVVLK